MTSTFNNQLLTFVLRKQRPQLQRVQLKAHRRQARQLLRRALGRLQQVRTLHHLGQMALGGQLQPLRLRPRLQVPQPVEQMLAETPRAHARTVDDRGEGPGGDPVEELREELDGEGGVDAALAQQVHGRAEDVDDVAGMVVAQVGREVGHGRAELVR